MTDVVQDQEIIEFGRKVFSEIGKSSPSAFGKNYWISRIMEWSMTKPDFKVNMFRLVDVLPALKSSKAIAEHVNEYLSPVASELGSPVTWGLRAGSTALTRPVTALLVKQGVQEMASLFIAGETPAKALRALRQTRKNKLSFTVDLLGEFCVSEKEAEIYLNRYMDVLDTLGKAITSWPEAKPIVPGHPGESSALCISVKLSALYSQCSCLNFERSVEVISNRLALIATRVKQSGALLYVDAEDTANNNIIYESFKRVFSSAEFKDFAYPGIVLQAYAKGARQTLDELLAFARTRGAPIAVRLVKGAYWDHETVMSRQSNWPSPLFSHKESSDANYEELSRVLIDNHQICLPAFGSHNVRSLSHACCYAKAKGLSPKDFELQMLYGMAEPIAKTFSNQGYLVRLYVPIGNMIVGMGYLVRRLLENTSNESFLRHTFFDAADVEHLLKAPQMREQI